MIPSGALRPSCRGLRCPAGTTAHPLFDSPDGKSIGYFEQSSVSGPVGVGGCAQKAFAPGPTRDPGPSHQAAPFAVDLLGTANVGGELHIQLQVPISPVFHPERYRLLAKIQLTEPGKGRNPGLMRNHLASPFDAASNATVTIPNVASQPEYQVHARFVLLDTETGYRSQYLQQSFLMRL